MNKEASDLLRLALLGMLAGGGTYGGMRYMHDLNKDSEPPKKDRNELELTLPAARIPKFANDTSVGDYFWPPVAFGGAAVGGFYGASKLYDHYRKKQLEQKIKTVEQQYLDTLQQAHLKTASCGETPLIDRFLEGLTNKIAEEMKKEALFDVGIPTSGPLEMAGSGFRNALDWAGDTDVGKMGKAGWLLTALLGGGATYAIAKRMDKQKEHAKEQSNIPTEIKLNVVQ